MNGFLHNSDISAVVHREQFSIREFIVSLQFESASAAKFYISYNAGIVCPEREYLPNGVTHSFIHAACQRAKEAQDQGDGGQYSDINA